MQHMLTSSNSSTSITFSMMQFNISPSVAELSPAFHYLSSFPTTADIIIIEVIEVDDIDKGYSRYVASVELNHLNDLLDDTTSLLSINQGSWFCLGRRASKKLPCIEVVLTT